MNNSINITRIKVIYDAFAELADQFIFIGGATVALYADRLTSDIRPTDDVDILIELLDYTGYAAIEEKLRSKGFVNDYESEIICRYQVRGIVVDVMPTSEEILGFVNRWYKEAATHSIPFRIDEDYVIRIFTAPYFLATKLDAFTNRGNDDGRTSTDFEDIVYLLNNRSAIWRELSKAPDNLRVYLQMKLSELSDNLYLDEWISSHLDYSEQKRVRFIMGNLLEFVNAFNT